MGLMIATVGAGFPGIAMLHLIVHAATKAALFCSAGIAHGVMGTYDLRKMALGRIVPVTAGLAAIAALSLAAVPPLAGGWSKEAMVKAIEHAGPFQAAAAILAGGLSAAYATLFAWSAFRPGEEDGPGARPGALAGMAALGAAVVVLSALWWPPARDAAAAWLGATLPEGSTLGMVVSFAAVALGVLAGLHAARTLSGAPGREWLGLAALYDRVVIGPFHALAIRAARVDDTVIDLIPRGAAAFGRSAARRFAATDDHGIDGQKPGDAGRAASGTVSPWSGLVGTATRATAALAALGAGMGERLADLLPGGSARLAGMAGADLRRLQTGLAHHYYTFVIAGFALAVIVLFLGG
jgi:NADH:ubiquinone oxidoreductase subunit 5 (subunit L)/multisubunit Na+/H+ antiporter MnhA subunit